MGDLSERQQDELFKLITEYASSCKGTRLGKIVGHEAAIYTDAPLPPPQKIRNAGPARKQAISDTIDQLLAWDVIEPSTPTTASPIVIVWQSNKWRFCVDFRKLNGVTVGDAYPMLRSDYVFSTFAGNRFFSLLDALKGYHMMDSLRRTGIRQRSSRTRAFINSSDSRLD